MKEIESLSMHITGLRAGKRVLADFMDEYRKSVLRIIDEQPTAYDVDAVVEELKEISKTYCEEYKQREGSLYLQDAVEIVRKGGV